MSKQLKGKIYWVLDDFDYIGFRIPKENLNEHIVARLFNVVIDDYMIKFYVCPHIITNGEISYNVNLLINDIGTKFNGTFSEENDPSHYGVINCELFNNRAKYMLQGRWTENENIYTFWAIIDKE